MSENAPPEESLSMKKERRTPILRCMSDIAPKSIDWLWREKIAVGRITLLVGMPGVGKSFLTCDIAARVSKGTSLPDGSDCSQGSVILITAEDDPHDTIRPRLDAHGADVNRIHLLSGVSKREKGKHEELCFTLGDIEMLRQAIEECKDCRLVIIDPIGSFLSAGCDANSDNQVRAVLTPIAKLAERYGVAVLIVAHRRKSYSQHADDSALGSRAFTGIARGVWHIFRDPDDRDRRLLLPGKSNLAADVSGMAYTISGEPAHLEWESYPVEMTADDAMAIENAANQKKPGPLPTELERAAAWLKAILDNGPRSVRELEAEWKDKHAGSKRTLVRAKQDLKVKSFKEGSPGKWYWSLPRKDAK